MFHHYAIDADTLLDALADNWLEADDNFAPANLCSDYSGRGMYGKTCLSLTAEEPAAVALFEFDLALALADSPSDEPDMFAVREVVASLANMRRQDSMGMSTVYYWPGIVVDGHVSKLVWPS